jgi:hypothetical protein
MRKRWNGMAAVGLVVSMASFLILQGGSMPTKKKVTPQATKEITLQREDSQA